MTPAEAARILELSPDATPDQIEAKYQALRTQLEDRTAKAPTPGLRAKYRESLDELTAAFETLTLAADSSALPVLNREQGAGRKEKGGNTETGGGRPETGGAAPVGGVPSPREPSRSPAKKSSKEFIVVALLAVAVLGAGGWWVVKTRAEKAEQARIAAEAKAEADRKAAAEKAEAERVDKLQVSLRAEVAELRARWEIFERAERDAERAATEARSELRSLRDAPAGRQRELELRAEATADYAQWLTDHLVRHPARTLRARVEELVSARAVDEASPLVEQLKAGMATLESEIRAAQDQRLNITGTLRVESTPAGAEVLMGGQVKGITPLVLAELIPGTVEVTLRLNGYLQSSAQGTVAPRQELRLSAELKKNSAFHHSGLEPNHAADRTRYLCAGQRGRRER